MLAAALACVAAWAAASSGSRASAGALPAQKERKGAAIMHARGEFEVQLTPAGTEDKAEGSTLGRMSIQKQYHGDLEGSARGEMLTAGTAVKGSAVYVAVERVTGVLGGRRGSFVLHHRGIMTRGQPKLEISVVPDSGTGELAGISGTLTVEITGGKHFYDLEYALAQGPGAE